MRKTTLVALAAATLIGTGVAVGVSQADAQGAPPAPPPGMAGPGPGMHRPMMGEGHGPMEGRMRFMGGMMRRMRQFALIYPAQDRALSGPDVQKIAEAFLLFNGNHTWKVTEVTEQPDQVTFALATADGTAIAHFTMDRHSAHVERVN